MTPLRSKAEYVRLRVAADKAIDRWYSDGYGEDVDSSVVENLVIATYELSKYITEEIGHSWVDRNLTIPSTTFNALLLTVQPGPQVGLAAEARDLEIVSRAAYNEMKKMK